MKPGPRRRDTGSPCQLPVRGTPPGLCSGSCVGGPGSHPGPAHPCASWSGILGFQKPCCSEEECIWSNLRAEFPPGALGLKELALPPEPLFCHAPPATSHSPFVKRWHYELDPESPSQRPLQNNRKSSEMCLNFSLPSHASFRIN